MAIAPNFMALKHALETKKMHLVSNREIARNTSVDAKTVGKFIRADISLLYFSTLSKLLRYFQREGLTIELGDFFSWQKEQLLLDIGPLIRKLDPVPTEEEIAEDTGIPILRMRNLVRGNVKRVYLTDLAALLAFFRQRGVEIELGDLLREEEGEKELA